MNRLMILVVLLMVGGWNVEVDKAWGRSASRPSASNPSVQFLTAEHFEQGILHVLKRRYGRPNHHLTLHVLFPKEALKVPKGKLHL